MHGDLKRYYVLVKDNLPMIILIPTILGGLWQILELSAIGTSYIRFFSVSQVIPDGLLFLFLLLVLYLSFNLGVNLPKLDLAGKIERTLNVKDNSEEISKKSISGPVNEVSWGLFFTIIILSGICVFYLIRHTIVLENNSKNFTVSNAFITIFFISVYLGLIKNLFPIYKLINLVDILKLNANGVNWKKKLIDFSIKVVLYSIIVLSIYFAVKIISTIIDLRNGIMDFGNFVEANQFETLTNHFENRYHLNKVLYSNDKYAIMEMIDSNQNISIKVYSIEHLFK